MPKLASPRDLENARTGVLAQRDPARASIAICGGTGCQAFHSRALIAAFEEERKKQGLSAKVDVRRTGCHGFCEKGPVVVIYPEEVCYVGVTPEDAPGIVSQTVVKKKVIDRLLYADPKTGARAVHLNEIPFYKEQMRLLMGNNSRIDPKSIDDYLALGGYSALAKALFEMTPEQVLGEVKKAQLRGRGGGGFPAGNKWETSRNAPEKTKYVIVNCHEGEAGVFKDRALFAGNPHGVLEGLIIGAYAIGAHQGFIYTRHDSPQLIESITTALAQAEEHGLLGENILGSGFSFKVDVHFDVGIFVSGESSALMKSIEGKTPEPRPKYIHTAVTGIWDRPSNLNNVETWANVPLIINKGSDWFAGIGTGRSKGTKLVSLAGNVSNTGVVEVPMGTSLRKIIYDIGGGIPNGKKLKAVHIGGSFGGSVPESLLDTPVDFDELAKVGAPLGAGGVIVMDEDTCMVDMARYFITFLSSESCGKCVPCREGVRQTLKVLTGIAEGKGKQDDFELLQELSEVMRAACLCALGRNALSPVLTTLRYFKDEYQVHIKEKRCPAHVCGMKGHSPKPAPSLSLK